jgi:hypothetical protein
MYETGPNKAQEINDIKLWLFRKICGSRGKTIVHQTQGIYRFEKG